MNDDSCGTTHASPNVTGALALSSPAVAAVRPMACASSTSRNTRRARS